jgi:hypothetical protein
VVVVDAQELLQSFDTWINDNEHQLVESNVHNRAAVVFHRTVSYHCDVLAAGAWPISSAASDGQLLLPHSVEAHVQLYSKFHTDRSTGRKLVWVHHLSFGILQASCFDKRYEFALSFYQMLVLLLVSNGMSSNE